MTQKLHEEDKNKARIKDKIEPLNEKSHEMPKFDEKSNSLVKKHLTISLFEKLSKLKTKEGGTLHKMIKLSESDPENKIGMAILDNEVIQTLKIRV